MGVIEHVEVDRAGAGQPSHPRSAGDDDRAAGAGRQQRPHLPFARGIVQNDQQPAIRGQGPVHGDPVLEELRNDRPVHAERPQEAGQHLVRLGPRRAPAVQVDEQLAIRERPQQAVRHLGGQGRHAHPARTGHHHDASLTAA
jgi:hypothetical protein